MQITLDHKEWYKIKVFDKDGNPLTRLIYINTESGAYESRSLTFGNKNDVGILEEGFKVEIPVEEEYTNRCCGRCDGDHDICVSDMVCDIHQERGCEICYGKRGPQKKAPIDTGSTIEL